MRVRLRYAVMAVFVLICEVLIALYVRDAFLRPYGGDILIVVFLCCLVRTVSPVQPPYLPLWVFLFAAAVEVLQACGIASLLPQEWTVVRITVGSTFSAWDLVCYAAGCLLFSVAEWLITVLKKRKI